MVQYLVFVTVGRTVELMMNVVPGNVFVIVNVLWVVVKASLVTVNVTVLVEVVILVDVT